MTDHETQADTFDYIVVGGGSAGCVLADRLSESGRHTVLLLEAGPPGHPLSWLPLSYSLFIDNPAVNWCYASEPDDGSAGRPIPVPRGRVLGGSSTINGLVYVRGQREDYDTWAQLGNRGWSFDDLLPLFRRIEHYEGGEDRWRAHGGRVPVSESPDESPLYDALFAAGAELGLARNPDYNGATQEGMCKTQTTISGGLRMSAERCYLRPARGRRSLRVRSRALARRVLLDGTRCVGIEYDVGARRCTAMAHREVILCAGSINSPQLLELSGIGREEVLAGHGIPVRHALPGVGEGLRDHYAPRVVTSIARAGVTYNDRSRGLGLAGQVLEYARHRRGFLGIPSAPVLAFLRTREELASPDIQVHFVPFAVKNVRKRQLMEEPGMTMTYYQLRPESTGSVHISSADPAAAPRIRFNFLSVELDRQTTLAGLRWLRRLVDTDAMAGMRGEELRPGRAVDHDDALLDWIRENAQTAYHPVGTCKMGADANAVVDSELRVHGIAGLRVADGSIMPTLISGNTNGPCMMIGEKAAQLVLASAS